MDWVRLYHDMPTDPKWRVIARKSGRSISEAIAIFNFVLVNASCNTVKRGETHNLDSEDIAAALDLDVADVDAVLKAMQGKVMEGAALPGWEKRNPKREDNSTERVRKYRETQRNAVKRDETLEQSRAETEQKARPRAERDGENFHRVCSLLGYNANDPRNWSVFIDMLTRDGLDFERHVWPEAERKAKAANKGRSIGFLKPGAIELRDAEKRSGSLPAPPIDWPHDGDDGWRTRLRIHADGKPWLAKWGPAPSDDGCKVPAHVLAEFNTGAAA